MSGSGGEGKLFWYTSKKVHCEPTRRAQYFRLFPQNVLRQTPQDVTVELSIDKIYAEQRAAFRLGNSGVFNLKKCLLIPRDPDVLMSLQMKSC